MEADLRNPNCMGIEVAVPFGQSVEERRDALLLFDWCLGQLRERGWNLRVTTVPVPDATLFRLEEDNP